MHDYHKVKDIISFAESRAKEQGSTKVKKINVSMGDSSGYSAESVRMYFDDESKGTVCEGAELIITPVKPMLLCPKCGADFERKLMQYKCPACGEEGIPSKTGIEVIIDGVETE